MNSSICKLITPSSFKNKKKLDKDNKDRASKDKAASAVPRKCATIKISILKCSQFSLLLFLPLSPQGLSVCADAQKVDRQKLAQTEFTIIEFDPDTFRVLLDYLHTGSCPLTCQTIPGLICAAEHYDLPELLQACFHHAKQFLRVDIICTMLISLENYYWRYTSASELVNMILGRTSLISWNL